MEDQLSKRREMSQLSQLQFIDLDAHDGIVKILSYLNIDELLIVADTSKLMRASAQVSFRRSFGSDFDLKVSNSVDLENSGKQFNLKPN